MSSGKKRVRRVRVADLLKFCEDNFACEEAKHWLAQQNQRAFFTTVWQKCHNLEWLDWLAWQQLNVTETNSRKVKYIVFNERKDKTASKKYKQLVTGTAVEDALRARI